MITDHDPKLVALFAKAEAELDDTDFTADVMRMIDDQRRKTLLVWLVFVIAGIIGFALVAAPVITAVSMATELLPTSLVNFESDWISMLLAPVNSVAAAIALGALAIRSFYRRVFR
jgi:hypothetical protein